MRNFSKNVTKKHSKFNATYKRTYNTAQKVTAREGKIKLLVVTFDMLIK